MKNGIIINGKQYELQFLHDRNGVVCDYCDLQDECNKYSFGINLCELLHDADGGQVYRYIGDVEDDKNN